MALVGTAAPSPAPTVIATDLFALAASPVVVLESLLLSIQMQSAAQWIPLPVMLMELRLIVIDDPDTPRPGALMAVPAQPTISLPTIRVLEQVHHRPGERDRSLRAPEYIVFDGKRRRDQVFWQRRVAGRWNGDRIIGEDRGRSDDGILRNIRRSDETPQRDRRAAPDR